MAKRIADKELTDRNWDQEEEGEEAGTFSMASDDILKNRAIKKAKRRNVGSEADGGGTFKGFKGFSLTPSTTSAGPNSTSFSGFGNGGSFKGFGGLSNGNGVPSFGTFTSPPTSTTATAFNGSASSSISADITTKQTNGSSLSPAQSAASSSSTSYKEYSRQLTALNCSVRDWITKHVNDNPLCDLNPIFRDYERHLTSIEKKYGTGATDVNSGEKPAVPANTAPPPAASFSSCSSSPTPALFSFGKGPDELTQNKTTSVPTGVSFNFGQKVDSTVLCSFGSKSTAPSFSFSSGNTSTQSPLFGATSSQPTLSFAAPKSENTPQTDENGDEETEEPPKPEVKEVKEEDAFYSKKCKMFYKKDSEFKEKGVGTLHLKQNGEDKTQMIIRADTNLGNILLNIILQSSLPCSMVGKNNVMLVCVPNPTIDDKNPSTPIPLLIRVKTEEDAKELLKILEEKKG
ncbi:nuclear pore complex protein Nup50 [Boleophthalmus pectinirostris]|uniref:nuclear pore complex protein Nup50 n=1 Tax=Boleophthalmus pectinirostris TaxID=150288 RepID=UPI000A1C52A8|nr:nuclear pore complex protein Nup50 [Boleophthalmus pectinirostris]